MVLFLIRRGDPAASPPPSDNPALTVPLASNDKAIIILGVKMFGTSDRGFISRSDQARRVGYASGVGHGGVSAIPRHEPSHAESLHIPFEGTDLPARTVAEFDHSLKDQMADLIYRRYIICREEGGPLLTPDDMRNY